MEPTTINTSNGHFISESPLTTELSDQLAPGLLQNAIDRRIVKIAPISTPLDQISRCAGSRQCGSMKVDYYSVDTKPTEAKTVGTITRASLNYSGSGLLEFVMRTNNDALFSASETLMLPFIKVRVNGSNKDLPMILYVVERVDTGLKVMVVNNATDDGDFSSLTLTGDITTGTLVVRMGRAATELDVQTAQFESLPVKKTNFCQIFKMQVEQSTFQKLANKEVDWNFTDQEKVAVADMRLGIEKNFLFGSKSRVFDPVKREYVYLTGGIWYQTDNEFQYDPDELSEEALIDLCRQCFTGNAAASARKILIAGSGLMSKLSKINLQRVIRASDTMVKWGLEFHEIVTNFGRLFVIHSEVFDQCGHANDGFVVDPDLIAKYVHVPFHAESLDLRGAGVRNTDAIVVTEASCLVLRHPNAHMRVISL